VTRYFCPQGELHRFQRGNDYYSVHSDALGSVRMITDAGGRVVSNFEYGAYGETLSSSSDGVPGGFAYRFVGALGCRADDEIGLIYMRNRWYDPSFGRFISRDPVFSENLYVYVVNSPLQFTDSSGLQLSENLDPWIQQNLDLIRDTANQCRVPPKILCALLAMELRGAVTRSVQQEKEEPARAKKGAAEVSMGPGQIKVKNSLLMRQRFRLPNRSADAEFKALKNERYALQQTGRYLEYLYLWNYAVRTRQGTFPQGGVYDDNDWARVLSGYNTGDVTSNEGTFGPLYSLGDYAKRVLKFILACELVI